MKVKTPLNIAFSIWIITLITDALLTDVVFFGVQVGNVGQYIGAFCMLFLIMMVASFPALFVLILLVKKCRTSGIPGGRALFIVYATGIACAVIVFYFFLWLFGLEYFNSQLFQLLGCTVLSAVLGITTQARFILNISAVEPE